MQLEHAKEDQQHQEQKLKRKISDLESAKRDLTAKIDDLTDKVGDLMGVEMTLKQKVKVTENSESELKKTTQEQERELAEAKKRVGDLEGYNDALCQKVGPSWSVAVSDSPSMSALIIHQLWYYVFICPHFIVCSADMNIRLE